MASSVAEIFPPFAREPMAEAPAVRTLDEIHRRAVLARASDVHIEPHAEGCRVRQRVDGILRESGMLPGDLYLHVTSRIKLLSGMDIADKRQPQDGRYSVEVLGRTLDIRVSAMPTISGEKVVIRILDPSSRIPTLDKIGMPLHVFERYRSMILSPQGFVIITGPTGSGKTTTLYASLAERHLDRENICSIEDPVEMKVAGVTQIQVNPRAGISFASALRCLLRQDPDVIMIGEMRDAETAAAATAASLCGQLIMTTLHSSDAHSAVERLLDLGVSRKALAAGLTGVVAQRLARRLCEACRLPRAVRQSEMERFDVANGTIVFDARGCDECGQTGYAGRTALFETFLTGEREREEIANGASVGMLRALAEERPGRGLRHHALELLRSGQTSIEEMSRIIAAGPTDEF